MRSLPYRGLTRVAAFVLGTVFLYSAYSKAGNVASFETVIESYGLPDFAFLAPVIILFELALGLLLVAYYKPKVCGVLAIAAITVFTVAYTYANVVHGVEDCGCFGSNPLLNASITAFYVRNAVLVCLAVLLMTKSDDKAIVPAGPWTAVCFAVVLIAAAFWEGRTFRTPEMFVPQHPLYHKAVAETDLPKYLELKKDSTYAIYIFSYDCPSCWDSMNNFMDYGRQSLADRLIGVNVGGKGKKRFLATFKPEFPIVEVGEGVRGMVKYVPSFLYVRNGVIEHVIEGKALHPQIFKDTYLDDPKH